MRAENEWQVHGIGWAMIRFALCRYASAWSAISGGGICHAPLVCTKQASGSERIKDKTPLFPNIARSPFFLSLSLFLFLCTDLIKIQQILPEQWSGAIGKRFFFLCHRFLIFLRYLILTVLLYTYCQNSIMTATPRLARSKSGADLLFDKMKQEKFQHEEQEAIDFLNTTLDLSITRGQLHQELKDGVILCK